MRGNEFQINYGGEWLDVDAQSVGGFDFTTIWTLDSTRITEKGRTLDLSVPATSKNTRVFNDHKLIPGDGVRRGINGMVVAGGVNITGSIYVSEYSGGRYSLMMAYGQSFGGFKRVNYAAAFAADTMTLIASDAPQSGGVVPDFGWYEYGNETAPHATVYDGGAVLFPSANLGHIIDALAVSLGYTVNYPAAALGRGYQAHAYGLVLPSFGVQSFQGSADVIGSAMNGFSYTTSGVATLSDLGLETAKRKFSRGYAAVEFVDVEVLRATKPVHISVPANSGVVVCGGVGYDVYNDWDGTQGAEFDLLPGQYFSFVRANEWHMVAGEYFWNRYKLPPAFEGNLSVTFSVTRSSANPVPGETLRLASALPEHPLEWWLDAYCNIIFAAWTVDESMKTITVKTYGERYGDALADAANHVSLEKEKVIAIESVKKYVDGFAQENHTRCDGKYDNLGSVLPFDRVLAMDNEYLEKSRDMAVIPFNDGGIQGGHDERFYLYLNDVRPDGEGGYTYDGVLTVFFENNVNTDGAVSLQEILNFGVGLDFNNGNVRYDFSRAISVSARVSFPLFRFAVIGGGTCVSLHGRDFVVRNAKWSEGVAQLDMVTFPREIPEVTPPSDIPLNFTMPNGGDITLTRNGSPTEVKLEYSLNNGSTWTEWVESGNVRTLTLSAGGRVWLRNQSGTSTGFSTGAANYYNFGFSDVVNANGDTRSLLCSTPVSGIISQNCFYNLFKNCTSLSTAPTLPATTLAEGCYFYMFYNCTSLVTAPELPATTLANQCYSYMFQGCTSLTDAPTLPAKTLTDRCYANMFGYCTSLVTAPELPATTLANQCYSYMFQGCTSLSTAPTLPAKTLAAGCYHAMFIGCGNISSVTMLATDISATNCLRYWLYNVAASGTLHLDSSLTGIPVDSPSGIPVGWIRNNL